MIRRRTSIAAFGSNLPHRIIHTQRVDSDFGWHKASGMKKNMHAFILRVTCRSDLLLPQMLVYFHFYTGGSKLSQVIVEQTKFYHQHPSITYQLLLTLSTQILGYSFAGITRRYLVRPPSMIWPGTLMSTAMFTTMHKSENKTANGWTISRWRFFLLVWMGSFAWYFLPGLLMPALSYFSVLTWFAPKNVVIANLVSYL